ncbi:MAG TPA: TonB family protein [Polyangia bacterium]|nr:TonB family protein [Polyangia bacterium]
MKRTRDRLGLGPSACAARSGRVATRSAATCFAATCLLATCFVAGAARAQDWAPPLQAPPAAQAPAPVLTKKPAVLKTVEPVYPPEALDAKLSADVSMVIDIDATGHVAKVDVPKPVGHGFDESAKAAVLQYLFSPAEIDGKPAAIRIEFTLHFVPQVAPPPPAPEAPPPPEPPPPPPPPDTIVARGRLREKGTRNPIKDAEISVMARLPNGNEAPAVLAATTDEDGRFVIKAQAGVPLRVIVADTSHDPCIRDLSAAIVSAASPAEIECLVARRLGTTYETKVRAPPPTEAVTRYTLAQPELTSVPGTFGDPLRVLQSLPGVARTPFGLGLLVIRGAAPGDSGIYVEGHQIPILYHFLGGPSVLTPRLIADIEFYPGNFGVKYGRATAGIVDVGITTDATPRLHAQADINFLDSSAYVEGPLGKGWTGSVSARRSYFDLWIPLVVPSSTTTVAPIYWDYQAGVHRDLGAGRLSLFAFGSNDSLNVVSKDPSTGNLSLGTETGFHKVIAIWKTTSHGWVNRLSGAYGYERTLFGAGQVGVNQSQNQLELRDELSRPLGKHVMWHVGFDGAQAFNHLYLNVPIAPDTRLYGSSQPQLMPTTIPLGTLGLGLYSDAIWDPGHGVTVTPGVRGDFYRYVEQNRASFDPRLVVRWKTSDKQTWKGGVGIYHQMQEPQLLDPHYGTPSLPTIWADQYSVGFVRLLTSKLSLDTTFYYVRRHDEPVSDAGGGFSPTGRERSYGMELILKHEFTDRFFGWIAYTLSRSEQTANTVNGTSGNQGAGTLQTGASTTTWYPTDFDQTHNLILVGSYAWRAWRFGTRFRLVTGTPTTPMLEGPYDADSGMYACRSAPTNSARNPTFNQLDVRIERTWTYNIWQLGAYLDVQNVYNAQNPELTVYDYRCRGTEPVRGIPFLPILGLRGMF